MKAIENKLNKCFGDEIKNITKKEVDAFFIEITKNSSYTTAKGYVSKLNRIFKNKNINITLSLKDYDIKESKEKSDGICTKSEVVSAIDNLVNPIDKFIVMSIFNGISGNRFTDILNLKKSDIDFNESVINVAGKKIKMDDAFKQIAKDAINQREYAFFTLDGTIKYYDLNNNSEYVLRSRPMTRNRNGLDPMGFEGFKDRIKNVLDICELNTTASKLEKSGYIDRMHSIKSSWTNEEVTELVKKEGMNVDAINLTRLYNNFYKKNKKTID